MAKLSKEDVEFIGKKLSRGEKLEEILVDELYDLTDIYILLRGDEPSFESHHFDSYYIEDACFAYDGPEGAEKDFKFLKKAEKLSKSQDRKYLIATTDVFELNEDSFTKPLEDSVTNEKICYLNEKDIERIFSLLEKDILNQNK